MCVCFLHPALCALPPDDAGALLTPGEAAVRQALADCDTAGALGNPQLDAMAQVGRAPWVRVPPGTGVIWFCGMVWCGVVWCGVVWCGVV